MAGHRCSKLAKQERHSYIVVEIAKGTPRAELVRDVRERWGISTSQALRCLQEADAERAQVYGSLDRAAVLTMAVQSAEKAVQLAIARGNPNEIIGAVRLLDNLLHVGAGWGENGRSSTGNRWER